MLLILGDMDSLSGDGDSITSGDLGEKSLHGGGKRKVPKVFSKEAITKLRAWLFQNLTVRFTIKVANVLFVTR